MHKKTAFFSIVTIVAGIGFLFIFYIGQGKENLLPN